MTMRIGEQIIQTGAALSITGNLCVSFGFQLQRLAHAYEPHPITRQMVWWCGFMLMAVGECSNFTAYGMAPASLVAPMDAVAIVSNVMLSRLIFKERVSRRSVVGVMMAILGTVAMALNAPQADEAIFGRAMRVMYVHDCITSYSTAVFIATISLAALWVANPLEITMGVSRHAKRQHVIYLCSLCGFMGTITAVSAKGLSIAFFQAAVGKNTFMFDDPSTRWYTYLLFTTLITSVLLQMKYLHQAFDGFSSSLVILAYYILFTSLTITAGAIIFNETTFISNKYAAVFIGGLILTYTGVFAVSRDDISAFVSTEFDQRYQTRISIDKL